LPSCTQGFQSVGELTLSGISQLVTASFPLQIKLLSIYLPNMNPMKYLICIC